METIWQEEEVHSEFPLKEHKPSPKALLLSYCYEGMQQLFSPVTNASAWWIPSKLRFSFTSLLVACHLGTLLRHGLDENWLFRGVFDLLSLTRLDIQISKLSSFEMWAGLCVALPLALAISVGVGSWLACRVKVLSLFLSFPIRVLTIVLCEVLPIPLWLTLVDLALQPILRRSYYAMANLATQLLAVPSLCSLCILFLMYTVGSADPRHSGTQPSLANRASSVGEMRTLWLRLSVILFFFLSRQAHPVYFAVLVCVTEAYLVRQYFWCRPYYNDTGNLVRTSTSGCLVVASAGCAIVPYSNASSAIAIMGCVSPVVVLLLTWSYFFLQPHSISLESLAETGSVNQLERRLRPYLATSEHANEVLRVCADHLAQNAHTDQRLLTAWIAGYCLHVLGNAKLAMLKLARCTSAPFSFEGSFQVYLVTRMLEARDQVTNEESYYVKYLMSVEAIKDSEQVLSDRFCRILEEVEATVPCAATVFKLWIQLQEDIENTKVLYEDLVKDYSFRQELINMYASFLSDVLSYNEDTVETFIKSCQLNLREPSRATRSYFDAELGLLVFSCSHDTFGTILYANPYVGELLQFTCSDLVGDKLADIVPAPMNLECLIALENQLANPRGSHEVFPKHVLLRTREHSLLEVVMEVNTIVISNEVYFLGKILKSKKEREVLLVSSDMKVIGSTASASQELGYETVEGLSLHEVIPDVEFTQTLCKSLFSEKYYALSFVWKKRSCTRSSYSLLYIYNNDMAECAFDFSSLFDPSAAKSIDIIGVGEEEKFTPKSSKTGTVNEMYRENGETMLSLAKMNSEQSCQSSSSTQLLTKSTVRQLKHLKSAFTAKLLLLTAILFGVSIYQQIGLNYSVLFGTLGQLVSIQESLAEISSDSRNFMLGLGDATFYQDRLLSHAAILSDLRDLREESKEVFESCELTSFFTQDLPVWHILGAPETQWETLEQFIESTQLAVNSLVYSNDVNAYSFLVFNSFEHGFLRLTRLRTSYSACVVQQVDTFLFVYLMSFSILVFVVLALTALVAFKVVKIRKLALRFFESNTKLLLQNSSTIKSTLNNRMAMIGRDLPQLDLACKKQNSGEINFPLMEYSWRPMVIPVLTLGVLALGYFHQCRTLAGTIDRRLDLDMLLATARVDAVQLEYWTREEALFDTTDSLENTFSLTPSRPPSIELITVRDSITETLHAFLERRTDFSLSTTETDSIFGNRNNRGFYELMQLSLSDSIEVLSTSTSISLQEYIVEVQELTQDLVAFSQSTEDYTLELLDKFERDVLAVNISIALLVFGVSVFVALGLVKQELARLELQKRICQRLEE